MSKDIELEGRIHYFVRFASYHKAAAFVKEEGLSPWEEAAVTAKEGNIHETAAWVEVGIQNAERRSLALETGGRMLAQALRERSRRDANIGRLFKDPESPHLLRAVENQRQAQEIASLAATINLDNARVTRDELIKTQPSPSNNMKTLQRSRLS